MLPSVSECRPWHWWTSLLQRHVAVCQIAAAACPVPCCGRARALAAMQDVAPQSIVAAVFEERLRAHAEMLRLQAQHSDQKQVLQEHSACAVDCVFLAVASSIRS